MDSRQEPTRLRPLKVQSRMEIRGVMNGSLDTIYKIVAQ
jgi:hypothetical protein